MDQKNARESSLRIERIARYEGIMDRILLVVDAEGVTPSVYGRVLPGLKELEAYYTSPEWQEDYAADEAGLLPAELKRGVLSQDGIDSLLERFRDAGARFEKLRELYLKQKSTLDLFLLNGAISQAQYDKSLGDLTEKMGMQRLDAFTAEDR